NAYNNTLAELVHNRGNGGGALNGLSVVSQLQQSLRSIFQFTTGSGSVQGLADLGLTFNDQAQLSFASGTFDTAQSTHQTDVASFLGGTAGGGFLGNATTVLNALQDTTSGLFTQTQNGWQDQIDNDNNEITDTQTRITDMQNSLTAQMTQADTLISS